ncbi:MAG: hypothetical protein O2819_00840 [Planctomycetota bacterium]|nr:hypothetical protein [Planctomycetota bacterium]MDA1105672.1 hypothetical protein [Planctomycetota bacterium]
MSGHDHHTAAPKIPQSAIVDDGRIATFARAIFAAGVIALGVGLYVGWKQGNPNQFAKIYLVDFMFVLALALGALVFTMIQHLTKAGWSPAVRRVAEAHGANLRWLWVLALPVVWLWWNGRSHDEGHGPGLDLLWPWANLEHLAAHDPAEAELVEKKSAYLNPDFFMIRNLAYFAIWALLANFYFGRSVHQDSTGSEADTKSMRKWAGPAIILFGVTTTFAAFDWAMSLSPAWFSTMFGVYFFCVCCTIGFSAIAVTLLRLKQLGFLNGVVSAEHMHDLGKFIFAFGVVFWAYIAFSQYMLIWYGNIPEETTWFAARQVGAWAWLSAALLFGHFVIPFVFLLSRWVKRWPLLLLIGGVWMMAFGWLDVWYLVVPVVPSDIGTFDTWNAFAAAHADATTGLGNPAIYLILFGMLGLSIGSAAMRLSRVGLTCRRDPRIAESIAFENF